MGRKKTPKLPVDPTRQLLKITDVLEQLRCHRSTLGRLRERGLFPAPVMISASPRWKQSDIDTFLEASREAP